MDFLSGVAGQLSSCFQTVSATFRSALGLGEAAERGGRCRAEGAGAYANAAFPEEYVARFAWVANSNAELTVVKGDRFEVLEQHGEYMYVRLLRDSLPPTARREGFVPTRCLAAKSSIESQAWYFGTVSRQDAEKLLLQGGNPSGSFLVRERVSHDESTPTLALSVLHGTEVIHYKIHRDPHGKAFFTEQERFPGVLSLVEACSRSPHGLCTKLSRPCKEPPSAPQQDPLRDPPPPYAAIQGDELDPTELILLREIGRGQYGTVYEGRVGVTPVAIKKLHQHDMDRAEFLREAALLKRLIHENVVRLYGVCTGGESPLIVTELMSQNLQQHLQERGGDLSLADMVLGCRQVALGLGFLSSQGVVHRDVAARNVLVGHGHSGVWKIADLGIARNLSDDLYTAQTSLTVPIRWTAPESLQMGVFSSASDVWSFGILMVEVMTGGQEPYTGMSNGEVRAAVCGGYSLPCPAAYPHPDLWAVASACWATQPAARPTFDQLHPLLYILIDDWADEFD